MLQRILYQSSRNREIFYLNDKREIMDKKIDTKRSWPKGYEPKEETEEDLTARLGLLETILKAKPEKKASTDIFKVMATRRSTRKFS